MDFRQKFEAYKRSLIKKHHSDDFEQQYKARFEMKLEHDKLSVERRALHRQLHLYRRLKDDEKEQNTFDRLRRIDTELADLHVTMHLNYTNSNSFNHYYRHIRVTRPIVVAFNLLLWFLLFRFGGANTGFQLTILVLAIVTTVGSIFELFFLYRVRERILKPVESLRAGVEEIMKGNYDVQVQASTSNEVGTLIQSFNEMAQKLSEIERLKDEYEENRKSLIANISHDLKTPMTSVQGYIEAISEQESIPPEKLKKYLKIIHNNTDYMNKLIDDLFLFSKLDMQKLDLHFEEIAIMPFFNDLMEEQKLELDEKGINFHYFSTLPYDRRVRLDPKRVYQILHNLIDNAVKYGPEDGLTIESRLYETGENVCIDVMDNGEGIDDDKLENIFRRFYRVDKARTKDFSSTGLGLAIARELSRAHGGDITVSSQRGAGTCFTVTLPFIKPLGGGDV